MNLPINIEKLIKGEVVETERIEYKSGWNPEDVIHSMCAFANDINNLGGGYIIIGVDEEDGVPLLPPAGLQKNQLDTIQKKLVELSNLIQPVYFGVSDVAEIQEKNVFVLYCPGGDNRPYSAPVSLSEKRKDHGYWIRWYSSTVQANPQEKKTLFELAAKIPFDDRINHQATVQDLKLSLIKEFLQKVGSPLFEQADSILFPELCKQVQIVKGSDEQLKRIVSREYRNRRIGDFLKELQLTEGRATGFPKIYDAMKRNGSPEPAFETDDERSYFLAVLPAHPEVKKKGQAGGEVKGEVRGEAGKKSLNDTERAILELLGKGPSSAEELANELSLKSRSGFITKTLRGLMKDGFIEFLHPESPRHPNQKYVLKTETSKKNQQDD